MKNYLIRPLPPEFPRNALATTIVLTFVGSLSWVLTREYPEHNARIVYFMLGQLTTFVGLIMSYYFATTDSQHHRPRFPKDEPKPERRGDVSPDPRQGDSGENEAEGQNGNRP